MQHKIYYSNKNIGKSKNIIFAMFHYEQGKKVIDFMVLSKKKHSKRKASIEIRTAPAIENLLQIYLENKGILSNHFLLREKNLFDLLTEKPEKMWGGDIETQLINMPRDSRTVACFENLQLAIKTKLQGYKELNEPFPDLPTSEWEMNDWEKHKKNSRVLFYFKKSFCWHIITTMIIYRYLNECNPVKT